MPAEMALGLSVALFLAGAVGVLARRNLVFVLLSLEVMLNAAALAFVAAGAARGGPEGQAMFLLLLAMAAAEVSVGLALAVRLRRRLGSLDTDCAARMRG